MLNVIQNFFYGKSIKLSDSFAVYVSFKDNDEEEMPECVGFTLPKLEQQEETQFYGNTSQTFLIPKYDSCKELTLTFLENEDNKITNFIKENSNYNLQQTFGKGRTCKKYWCI